MKRKYEMIHVKMYQQPFMVADLIGHNEIKEDLLTALESMPNNNVDEENDGAHNLITKCDWYTQDGMRQSGKDPRYWEILFPHLHKLVLTCMNKVGVDYFQYDVPWFQQYYEKDCHDWHMHPGSMYNVVYYLELPEDGPQTIIRNPIIPEETMEVGAKEGQVAIFPAILKHKSPPSNSKGRKSIIATNIN